MHARILLLFLFLVGRGSPCRLEAQGDPLGLAQVLSEVEARALFYGNAFPNLKLPPDFTPERLHQLKEMLATRPDQLPRKLTELTAALDRLVLPGLKRRIFEVGSSIDSSPTTEGTLPERKLILLEFTQVLSRLGVPFNFYYSKGKDQFLGPLQLPSDHLPKLVDDRFRTLAGVLASEMKGDGTGGGGGGVSGTATIEYGPDDPRKPPDGPIPPAPDDVAGFDMEKFLGRHRWIGRFLTYSGLLVLVFGSLLALFLPRVRSAVTSGWTLLWATDRTVLVLDESILSKVQNYMSRGDFRKALNIMGRIVGGQDSSRVTYLTAICQFRLLNTPEALRVFKLLKLEDISREDIARLALICEETRHLDSAIALMEFLEKKDPKNVGVASKLSQLKSLAEKPEGG